MFLCSSNVLGTRAAMERAEKLRRLNVFRRSLPHISASALAAVLDEVARSGIPDLRSRYHCQEATALELLGDTPYGPLLTSVKVARIVGGDADVLVINPFAMLHKAALSVGFDTLLRKAFARTPCTPEQPWNLIVYSDEVVPGNQMSYENLRKLWVVYWSFLEFGMAILSREDAWFCMLAQRSTDVAKLCAGMSQVFGCLIKLFFGGVHDLSSSGVLLTGPSGNTVRIFAKLGMILQDGAAHKSVWHCKGDAGTKFCMLCLNLYSKKSEIVDENGENLLTCTLVHEDELHFASDDDIRGAVRRLAAKSIAAPHKEFQRWQQAIGFRHEPHNLMLDESLRDIVLPATQFCHDWMHAIFVHGVFNTVAFLLLHALVAAGRKDIWETFHGYMALWTLPMRLGGGTAKDVFNPKRSASSRKAKAFKATASEGLSLINVMAYFVQAVIMQTRVCWHECKAFVALADVVDLLRVTSLGLAGPTQLRATIALFLNSCLDAGWQDWMHPKFHWLVHLPSQLARFKALPTCWVHERKHRMVKRYATEICNTVAYEKSILGEVICHHLSELSKPDVFDSKGLVKPREASRRVRQLVAPELELPEDEPLLCSNEVRFSEFESCSKGDVVLLKEPGGEVQAGQVWLHVSAWGIDLSIVSMWDRLKWDADTAAAEWQMNRSPRIIFCSDLLASVVHTVCRAGVTRTLVPCHIRAQM